MVLGKRLRVHLVNWMVNDVTNSLIVRVDHNHQMGRYRGSVDRCRVYTVKNAGVVVRVNRETKIPREIWVDRL